MCTQRIQLNPYWSCLPQNRCFRTKVRQTQTSHFEGHSNSSTGLAALHVVVGSFYSVYEDHLLVANLSPCPGGDVCCGSAAGSIGTREASSKVTVRVRLSVSYGSRRSTHRAVDAGWGGGRVWPGATRPRCSAGRQAEEDGPGRMGGGSRQGRLVVRSR